MIAAALKLLAPYLIGAFVVLGLGTGATIWYLKGKAERAETALAAEKAATKVLAERIVAANNAIRIERENSEKVAGEYKRQIEEMENDIAKRGESIARANSDLQEANAVIGKLLKDGDDETKHFLGPLPSAIIGILREPAIGVPRPTIGGSNRDKAATGLAFTGYSGANIDSD